MKNCIVKIIDNVFEKNEGGGLFPLSANKANESAWIVSLTSVSIISCALKP